MDFSDETLKDYFYCKLKAYYKSSKIKISNNSFYYFEKYLKKQADKSFTKMKSSIQLLNDSSHIYSKKYNATDKQIFLYDYIEITKENFAVPIFISGSFKVHQEEKNFYAYKSKQLNLLIDNEVHHYKLFHMMEKSKKSNYMICLVVWRMGIMFLLFFWFLVFLVL